MPDIVQLKLSTSQERTLIIVCLNAIMRHLEPEAIAKILASDSLAAVISVILLSLQTSLAGMIEIFSVGSIS
jgi:hypothetical protein